MVVKVPTDLESRVEFRLLLGSCQGRRALALGVVLRVWLELGQLARATRKLGVVPRSAVGLLVDGVVDDEQERRAVLSGLGLEEQRGEGDGLSRFFRMLEDGTGFACEMFGGENEHVHPDYVSQHKKGSLARTLVYQKKRAEVEAQQQCLFVAPERFVDGDGNPLNSTEVNRVMMLIINLDRFMGHAERKPDEYSSGMVQDAYRVLQRHSGDSVDRVLNWINLQRGRNHPGLPATTEQVLRDWERVSKAVI